MEATATASTTGSHTIADLIPRSVAEHADSAAVRYKRDGACHEVTYRQLAEIVATIGIGSRSRIVVQSSEVNRARTTIALSAYLDFCESILNNLRPIDPSV